jgi:hypothetical protein
MSRRLEPEEDIIRIEINGDWWAPEMGRFLLHLNDLYRMLFAFEMLSNDEFLRDSLRHYKEDNFSLNRGLRRIATSYYAYLRIIRIDYASPGIQDLAGLGVIVGHIKDIILKLIDLAASRDERRLRNSKLEIEILREKVKIAKEVGYTDAQIRNYLGWTKGRVRTIYDLVESGKIRSVDTLSDKRLPPGDNK